VVAVQNARIPLIDQKAGIRPELYGRCALTHFKSGKLLRRERRIQQNIRRKIQRLIKIIVRQLKLKITVSPDPLI
jgi:hypothetical protein